MESLVATIAAFASALACYVASAQCRWPAWRRARLAPAIAALFALVSLVFSIHALGAGAGIAASLAAWMSGAIVIPYLAWRREARTPEASR